MKLSYNDRTDAFILRVPRNEENVPSLVREFGLNFSEPASTAEEAVLFTHEPYAACDFAPYANEGAFKRLEPLLKQIELSRALTCGRHFDVPTGKELWDFQKASLDYALERKHCLVGDEPGLGKTAIAIAYANEIQAQRVLCIVPASIRLQWENKIREWSTMPWPFYIHNITHGRIGANKDAQWTIISYDLARTEPLGKALAASNYDLLILDEGHYLKTIDSRRTRAVFGGGTDRAFDALASRADRVLALTGTPLPNRPREAYTLARGLCHESIDWASEDAFKERFNPSMRREIIRPDGSKAMYIDERSGRHGELQARMRVNFMTRHLKREVMTQLKMPVFDLIQVEETGPVKQALAAEKLLDIDPENLEGADASVLGSIATVRRMMGLALAPQVADWIDMLIEGGEDKLVLFAWHIEVLNILEERLGHHGLVRVDGSTGSTRKARRVEAFRTDKRVKIILGNVLSLGTGTDGLQDVAWHALIAEPDWVPGNNVQCFDRLDRGGQTRSVQGDIFVAPGSFAEKVLASALRKGQTTHKALDRVV